jgi:glycosyltransferase involved in cell wall biosynthesis
MQSYMARRPRIGILQLGDYRGHPPGGIPTFLEAILPHMREQFQLKLVGVATLKSEKVGLWQQVRIGANDYEFLPVLHYEGHTSIPDRIRLAVALLRHKKAIRAARVDLWYVHTTEPGMVLTYLCSEPVILHAHGLYNVYGFSRFRIARSRPLVWAYDHLYPHVFRRFAKVLGVGSEAELEQFCTRMRVRSAALIPTCINEQFFFPMERAVARRKLRVDPNQHVVLLVGRITRVKNPRAAIDAVRALQRDLSNVTLVLVGDGPERMYLQKYTADDPAVQFTGELKPGSVALWMNAADVLLIASHVEAFTSIVALEALSCGIPVVSGRVSAIDTLVRNGVNGMVVDKCNPDNLASALKTVLLDPPDRRAAIASAEPFTSRKVSALIRSELETVIGSNLDLSECSRECHTEVHNESGFDTSTI